MIFGLGGCTRSSRRDSAPDWACARDKSGDYNFHEKAFTSRNLMPDAIQHVVNAQSPSNEAFTLEDASALLESEPDCCSGGWTQISLPPTDSLRAKHAWNEGRENGLIGKLARALELNGAPATLLAQHLVFLARIRVAIPKTATIVDRVVAFDACGRPFMLVDYVD
jgi:hypothetical protein